MLMSKLKNVLRHRNFILCLVSSFFLFIIISICFFLLWLQMFQSEIKGNFFIFFTFVIFVIMGFIFFFIKNTSIIKRHSELLNVSQRWIQEIETKHATLVTLLSMVDNLEGFALWAKDEYDRYLFADYDLRHLLLNGKDLREVIGKTDTFLMNGQEGVFCSELKNLKPEDLPNIKSEDLSGTKICNITDIVTRSLKIPCRFYEEIGDRAFDVWKTPTLKNGEIIGTVGVLKDITKDKEKRKKEILSLAERKEAFKIDSTENYYLKRYDTFQTL